MTIFNSIKKALCAVKYCLRSFLRDLSRERKKRILGACGVLLAVLITFSAVITGDGWFFGIRLPLTHAAETVTINGVDCSRQSLELYPNGDDSEEKITLDGMMPENASAEAVDVSSERSSLAAYDITITDGENEFQPGEGNPIRVEINNPAIPESGGIQLWHIKDDGTREEIKDFTVEDGKLSFYATGFSIYEIVTGRTSGDTVTDLADLTDPEFDENGFHLYYIPAGSTTPTYFTAARNNNYALVETTNESEAAVWHFEKSGDNYNLYTDVNGQKMYLHNNTGKQSGNAVELLATDPDMLKLTSESSKPIGFFFKLNGANKWLQHSNGGGGIRYYTSNSNVDNSKIYIKYVFTESMEVSSIDRLVEKPYGLFHYSTGSTVGNAMMAEGDTHSLVKLVLPHDNDRTLYVDENNEIDMWQFHYYPDDEEFTISVNTPSGTQYLCAGSTGISTTADPASAGRFKVHISLSNRVQLETNGYYVTFQPRGQDEGGSRFHVTRDASDDFTWLNLLDRSSMDNSSNTITFSADRVSVSDIKDGQKVIVYIRIWNEEELRYDMYAIDRDGSLYPCYASGGKIMWLGNTTGSLEWEFTEYVDQVTKLPNYYYELYNPYSEKYLAPQLTGNQVLSENKIGINIPGRRDGEFYSNVIAWDNNRYAYIGLRPNADKTALEPCAESAALPFYFATLEELNLSDRLHEVPTLDNNQYGITMRMVNFDLQEKKSYGASNGSEFTWEYFGDNSESQGIDALKPGLLSTWLDDNNGYPIATPTGKNISAAFNDPDKSRAVNHLFLERVHESSGYFEFDSTQNFATLKNQDGNFNIGANGETDFIMYHELGTHERRTDANSLKHGQFFPYDIIKPGVFATRNSQNLFSSLTSPNAPPEGQEPMGKLPENDPRKYEQLYLIQSDYANADYYFGMEMDASFVQTPSGLDAWGHDIIFEFTGDDDFWLYVDNQLVLDLGGVHSAVMGKINFRTGDIYYDNKGKIHDDNMGHTTLRQVFTDNFMVKNPDATAEELNEYLSEYFADGESIFKDYSTHTMKMFYMERGANASNLHMRFNIASVTPGNVVVSKSVSGEGADMLDEDFLEYPFQIFYKIPDGEHGELSDWIPLKNEVDNNDQIIRVTYQNSNHPVNFVQLYRPPGFTDEQAYRNIYFINPSRSAEISFPDDAIEYKIVECAVDTTVYGNVTINGEPAPYTETVGELKSYHSGSSSALERPSISFDNHVNENVIKDLMVTKKLLDENGQEVTDDPATFNFRLSISSVEIPADQIPLANMYSYLVLSPDKNICRFDPDTQTFAETSVAYSRANYKAIQNNEVPGVSVDDVTFKTSGFGAISGIPSGYTICVPGLPVGSIFKITEDPKTGYGLMGYERVMGSKIHEGGQEEEIPSYLQYDGNPLNIGKVIADENPQMEVLNRKGYGISAKKQWSDLSITTGHSTIYTAVYVDGTLLDGSVKQIKSPATSANYFWTRLEDNADGSERTDLSGYAIREVTISNSAPTVTDDGTVKNPGTVTMLDEGDRINLTASRIPSVTPEGEDPDKEYGYFVSYGQKNISNTSREDTVTNTREGGIAIRLFKWDTDIPLANGQFTLTDSGGNTVGTYSSDANGLVTVLYDFEKDQTYTLTETVAPRGYVGMQKNLCFKVNSSDGSVSLFYDDGDDWGTKASVDLKWANDKPGDSGLSAYIDIYNKQFNFKVAKMDKEETGLMLDNAHFALYKQTNTTIGGYEKNRDPMTGFEDMVTVNGELYICGGDSGRTINPGRGGSVYFLTETQAPLTYSKLDQDVIFRISALGVPSLISDGYNGQLVETEDSYIYTLSVPNEKRNESKILTVRKVVSGSGADVEQEFTFTLTVEGAAPADAYEWFKNGVAQSTAISSGGTFKLKHNESVEIALPMNANVTVSENSGEYIAEFKLNNGTAERLNRKTITLDDDATLLVTNTLDVIIPTGVNVSMLLCMLPALGAAAFIIIMLLKKRLRYY